MKRFIFLLIALLVTSVTMGTTFTVVTPGASDTTVVKSQTYPGTTGLTVTEVTPGASDTTAVIGLTYPRTVVPAGSILNVSLGEPVSIANGGTNATSAAGALTALGGASLNGSDTVDFSAKDIDIAGFASIGGTATTFKVLSISGYLPTEVASYSFLPHGVTGDKIIGFTTIARYATNAGLAHNTATTGYTYVVDYTSDGFILRTLATGSENLLGVPVTVLYFVKE